MKERKHPNSFLKNFLAYLNQPLFDKNKRTYFNPLTFRKVSNVKLLERCWQLDYEIEAYRLRLEFRWQEIGLLLGVSP
ncbi:MAG: hypothetical protein AAFX95_16820 [Cyanobacteria bacterium J06639_16]